MKAKLVTMLCAPIFLQAQLAKVTTNNVNNSTVQITQNEGEGIKWVDNLNWQQVKKKAKKENKYIFIDCFATWCGPCKKMDKEVYVNDSIGSFLNSQFISVKLQMDSAKGDDAFTRSWYNTAKEIATTYRITAFPTFLFFAPNGEIVYKDLGYKIPQQFMQTARNALNPSKQYYVLLKKYKKGKKDFAGMPNLITMAKQLGDTANYYPLLTDYYTWLLSQDKNILYAKGNIAFIAGTLESSAQSPFGLFYPDGTAVDKAMNKEGYAKEVTDHVILKEKVNPFFKTIKEKTEPDWNILYNAINKDYKGDYAERAVMDAKMKWYYYYGHMLKFATTLNDKMEKYGSDTTSMGEDFKLNTKAYLVWAGINDVPELKRMTPWMAGVVRRGEKGTGDYVQYWPLYMDTYANLLYKVGETPRALQWQELAVSKAKELAIDKGDIKTLEENLEKMKKGEPTWPKVK